MSVLETSKRIQTVRLWNKNHSPGIRVSYTRNNMFKTHTVISEAFLHPNPRTGLPCVRVEVDGIIPLEDLLCEAKDK